MPREDTQAGVSHALPCSEAPAEIERGANVAPDRIATGLKHEVERPR